MELCGRRSGSNGTRSTDAADHLAVLMRDGLERRRFPTRSPHTLSAIARLAHPWAAIQFLADGGGDDACGGRFGRFGPISRRASARPSPAVPSSDKHSASLSAGLLRILSAASLCMMELSVLSRLRGGALLHSGLPAEGQPGYCEPAAQCSRSHHAARVQLCGRGLVAG